MIFIGGDIVHSKTQGISPEIIESLHWWFESLAEIAETHVILGNHDGLILNEDRQDAITPIVNALNNPKIKLYKKSGVYPSFKSTNNQMINWCVFSCFDEKGWDNVKPVENEINIACFHGAVWGSKTDVDWELEGEVNVDFFDGYDFAFLGDIHKLQYLDTEKRVAYPGSTIQQNFGEDIQKGYLLWEIENKYDFKSKFIAIQNPHPYITVDWQGNVEDTMLFCSRVKTGSRFRIRSTEDISQAEIKLIHHYLKNDKKAHEIVYQTASTQPHKISSLELKDDSIQTLNIRKKSDRNILLKDLYTDISDENLASLDRIFYETLDKIPKSLSDVSGQKWSINTLDFSNTFSYGKDNHINFNKLTGVVGLFGNNRAGKSSIPGTITYTLFNTSDRGAIKNQNIVNIRKGDCTSKINLTIGTETYEITRETKKKTNRKGITSATTKLDLKNLSSFDTYQDETEEQRRETEKVLRKIIGTAEDFLYTSFASQGEMNLFIKEKSSARKTVLSKFLNLDVYEALYKESREDYIVLKKWMQNKQEKNWNQLNESLANKISDNIAFKKEIASKIQSLRDEEVTLKVAERELENNIKSHPSGHTYDSACKKLSHIVDKINDTESLIDNFKISIEENNVKLNNIKEFKKSYPIEDLEEDKVKLDNLTSKLNSMTSLKRSKNSEVKRLDEELKILDIVPCEDKYPTCKFIKKAHEAKKDIPELKASLSEVETAILEVRNVVNRLSSENIPTKIKKYNDILKKEYKLSVDNENYTLKIESLRENLEVLKQEKQKFTDLSLELEKFTDDVQSKKLKEVKQSIKEINNLLFSKEREASNIERSNFDLENQIKKNNNDRDEYNELITKWKLFDMFSFAVSKKGLPSILIGRCLPRINKEIKNILSGVVSFDIILKDEDNNTLNVYIDYGDSKRIIECASGMEKMIASIAIRVALINISTLPKSDMFIIDEGFGALDDTNVEACGRLLKSLKKYFKTILIISHVDSIKDIVDKNLEISVKGMDSYVEYR